MSTNNATEIVKNSNLNLTANPMGKYHKTWSISKDFKFVPVTYGVYKPEGFAEAYAAMRKLKPNLSELSFATRKVEPEKIKTEKDKWDTDIVDIRLFDGVNNLVQKYTETEEIETGTCSVTLSLVGPDVSKNIDYIKAILQSHC